MEEGYYVYGITAKNALRQIEEPGLKEEGKIYFVSYKDIKAVVSKVPLSEFGQEILKAKVKDTKWLELKMKAHERVNERIMLTQTVIPLKFGTIFQTEENLRKMLEEKYLNFKFLLEKLRNKQEWAVKVYIDTDVMREKVVKRLPQIRELEKEISTKPPEATSAKKKRERLIEEAIEEKALQYSYQIYKKLRNWAEDAFTGALLLSKELAAGKTAMILDAAYLVDIKKRDKFFKEFEDLKKEFMTHGLVLEYSGPQPPYSFVSSWEGEKETES